mmetsp:Transcript_22101/g.33075  ORF Transcript_22101/g.33075 Transcript_22101/m.33075 type:complete len:88 (-) Transcript_22101:74-337(-)
MTLEKHQLSSQALQREKCTKDGSNLSPHKATHPPHAATPHEQTQERKASTSIATKSHQAHRHTQQTDKQTHKHDTPPQKRHTLATKT